MEPKPTGATTADAKKAEIKKVQEADSDDSFEYEYHKGMPEKEFEENLEYLKKHPLFIKEIPENIEENPDVKALQNLLYNDEPINIARHFNVDPIAFPLTPYLFLAFRPKEVNL